VNVIRQTAVIFALGWMLAPLQFATTVVVAREVGAEGKGILAVLAGITAVVSSLAGLGLPSGAAFLYRQPRYDRSEVVGSAVAMVLISSAAMIVASMLAGDAFVAMFTGAHGTEIRRLWVFLALLTAIPVALFALGDVVLIVSPAMTAYTARTAGTALLTLALTWLLLFGLHGGITGILLSQPVAAVFGLGLLGRWLVREGMLRRLRVSVEVCRALLRVGMQQYAIDVVALVAKRVDVFLIAALLSMEDAGFYAVAVLIPQTLMTIPRAAMWPLVGSFSQATTSDPAVLARVSRLQVALLGVMTIALVPVAPLLVDSLFGAAFAPAVAPFRWALAGIFATPVTISVNAFLTARGRPGLSIVSAIVGTGVQVVLILTLVQRWGTSAAAVALSVNYIVTAAVQMLVLRAEQSSISLRGMLVPTREDVSLACARLRARRSP
jgi:O-antigen/teichoic acid export membrane protein